MNNSLPTNGRKDLFDSPSDEKLSGFLKEYTELCRCYGMHLSVLSSNTIVARYNTSEELENQLKADEREIWKRTLGIV